MPDVEGRGLGVPVEDLLQEEEQAAAGEVERHDRSPGRRRRLPRAAWQNSKKIGSQTIRQARDEAGSAGRL